MPCCPQWTDNIGSSSGRKIADAGHHVDHQPGRLRVLTAKVDRVAFAQKLQVKRRDGDHFRAKIASARRSRRRFAGLARMAKSASRLNSAAPYQHAGLAAHQQGANSVLPDRRKDSEYRVRDQVKPLARDILATISRIPASAGSATADTIRPILRRPRPLLQSQKESYGVKARRAKEADAPGPAPARPTRPT